MRNVVMEKITPEYPRLHAFAVFSFSANRLSESFAATLHYTCRCHVALPLIYTEQTNYAAEEPCDLTSGSVPS
jgi:hypothetical protein